MKDRNLDIIIKRFLKVPKSYLKIFKTYTNKNLKLIKEDSGYRKVKSSNDRLFYTEEEKNMYYRKNDLYFCNMIEKFVTSIKEKNPNFDLTNFYNNFDNILFIDANISIAKLLDMKIPFIIIAGWFNPFYKTIVNVTEEYKYFAIMHELLHMSSSHNHFSSGFMQNILSDKRAGNRINFGRYINEGYTELLNIRYFGSMFGMSYPYQVFIANKLEHLIGKDKMEKLYINSNLQGLIDEMTKYLNKNKVMKILNSNNFYENLLYLEIMSINKSKMENKKLDLLFLSQIDNVIENGRKKEKTINLGFKKKNLPSKDFITLLNDNLSDNEKAKVNDTVDKFR